MSEARVIFIPVLGGKVATMLRFVVALEKVLQCLTHVLFDCCRCSYIYV